MWWLLLGSLAADAAPPLSPARSDSRRSWADFGWDPAWVVEVGQALPGPTLAGQRTGWTMAARAPLALLAGPGGGALEGGLIGRWGQRFGVQIGATSWLTAGGSDLGSTVGWGSDLLLRPGIQGERLTGGLELGWHQAWLTWVRHSDAVMDLFDDRGAAAAPAPRNVLLPVAASRFRGGLCGGLQVAPPVVLGLGAALEWTPNTLGMFANPSLGWLPFSMHATVEWTW